MRILIVKTSSMGDVIHCLPVVSDLLENVPHVQIDWVVEEGFQDIPRLHPGVEEIIPVAVRRWRKSIWKSRREFTAFRARLRSTRYDYVIDAQGLVKSALIAKMARGPVLGFDRDSVREPLASSFYDHVVPVSKSLHAVTRIRKLCAQHFGYELSRQPRYGVGLAESDKRNQGREAKTVCLFHGTTWASKHWPQENWRALAILLQGAGYNISLPFFGAEEETRARHIEAAVECATVIPAGSLKDLANRLRGTDGAVSVDTGLGHLAVAFDVPLVGLYGPTKPGLTGFQGSRQVSLANDELPCAPCLKSQCRFKRDEQSSKIHPPCFSALTPQRVFDTLMEQMKVARTNQ